MAKSFRIHGGTPLKGDVTISGYKNSATPIIAATLLTRQECALSNIPRVADVENTIAVLEHMGVHSSWRDAHTLVVRAERVDPAVVEKEEVRVFMRRMRSSVFFFGPLLARFGNVRLPYPGGCDIGARPIAVHIEAFRDLGYEVRAEEKWIEAERMRKDTPKEIILSEFSVSATENVLFALARTEQEVAIRIAAAEPQVQDVAHFLEKLGVAIEGIGTHDLVVRGREELGGGEYRVGSDPLETGTFILACLASGGHIRIHESAAEHLMLLVRLLGRAGADIRHSSSGGIVEVRPSKLGPIARMQAMPYPGIATDLQPFLTVLATQLPGPTLIHDPLYENRMHTAEELKNMGADITVLDAHRILVQGPTRLHGARVVGRDLRDSAALVMAGLLAEGETVVEGVEHLERGYENFAEKLRGLGADIREV